MSYRINIDHARKIVYYSHDGFIKRESIGEVWAQLLKYKEFTEMSYDLISDYRGGRFVFSENDENIAVVDNFFYSIKNILNGKREAVILDDPYSTAVSALFETKYEKSIGFSIKIFSTPEAAYRWLGRFDV